MGKKLDALLGRSVKPIPNFKPLVNLALSRLPVLKKQRQLRCSIARSDVSQFLNHAQHQRALLRVEQVIKEHNMLDAFVMIEAYLHLLIERLILIENTKECPDELKEAISSLIFAASRCGEFPELQEIHGYFMLRFGKEFVARAVELRNNCGVNPKMIQKMSTRQPSMESRMKVLQEIASENGITLQLDEEESSEIIKYKPTSSANLDHAHLRDDSPNLTQEKDPDEKFSGSLKTRRKYRHVAAAAQAAYESAAHAAEAARAAMELCRSESQDRDSDYQNSSTSHRRYRTDDDGSSKSGTPRTLSTGGLDSETIHPIENSESESEGEELAENHGNDIHPEEFEERMIKKELEGSPSISSLNSAEDTLKETKELSPNVLGQTKPTGKEMVFNESDDESRNEHGVISRLKHHFDGKFSLHKNEFPKVRESNAITDEKLSDDNEGIKFHHSFLKRIRLRYRGDPHMEKEVHG